MPKIVLITGASSGLGKATADHLHNQGFTVVGTSRHPDRHSGLPYKLLQLDVTRPETIQSAVGYIRQEHGQLDVLINNAGVGITGPVEETPMEEVERAFNINFYGPLRMMQTCLPLMRRGEGGQVINITSIAGHMGLPFRGVYSASKSALQMITEAYRLELSGQNITVTDLAPGDYATNIADGRYHAPVRPDSPYSERYARTLKLIDEHVDEGGDPKEVARKIHKIIGSRKKKVHYTTGKTLQQISIRLKSWLPGRRYEKMLKRHFKL